MKNKILFALLLITSVGLFAQDDNTNSNTNKTWVMGVPQYLFRNGVKIELDRKLTDTGNWITFSPALYHRGTEPNWISSLYGFESMHGAGLDIYYRKFFHPVKTSQGFYFMAGGGYEFFSFRTTGYKWDISERDGINYYEYNDEDFYYSKMHGVNVRSALGFKILLNPHLAVDVYLGPGLTYSFINQPESTYFYSETSSFGYGSRGIGIYAGVRLGVGW